MSDKDKKLGEVADSINKTAKISVDGNKATVEYDEKTYKENLIDGVTMDMVEKVTRNNKQYVDASMAAVTKKAEEVFTKHKGVDEVVGTMPFERSGSVTVSVSREKEFRSPLTNETIKRPDIKCVVKSVGNKDSKAYRKRLRDQLAKAIAK